MPPDPLRTLARIEVLEDRTAESTCDQGFLTIRRLVVRNLYADGTSSAPYPCDIAYRPSREAVVAVLFERRPDGGIDVLLRRAPRVAAHLPRSGPGLETGPMGPLEIMEVVAGMLEVADGTGPDACARRARAEALEEAGLELSVDQLEPLGAGTFASPGTSDELVQFQRAEASLAAATGGTGDGSVMEEHGTLLRMDLGAAILACRDGRIPDMKTEVALCRLRDALQEASSPEPA